MINSILVFFFLKYLLYALLSWNQYCLVGRNLTIDRERKHFWKLFIPRTTQSYDHLTRSAFVSRLLTNPPLEVTLSRLQKIGKESFTWHYFYFLIISKCFQRFFLTFLTWTRNLWIKMIICDSRISNGARLQTSALTNNG